MGLPSSTLCTIESPCRRQATSCRSPATPYFQRVAEDQEGSGVDCRQDQVGFACASVGSEAGFAQPLHAQASEPMIPQRCTRRETTRHGPRLVAHAPIKHNCKSLQYSDNMSLSSRSLQSIFSNENDRKLFVDCFRRSQTDGPPGVIDVPKIVQSPGLDGQSIISQDTWPSNDYTASSISDLFGISFTETSAGTETTGDDACKRDNRYQQRDRM